MNPDKIPLELRQKKQWVSFKIGPELGKNGKPIKVPFLPRKHTKPSPTDPATWITFEAALAGGNPAYALTKEDGLIFIDLDGSGQTPVAEDLAEQLLETFPSYTELSSSQTGMHIICRGQMQSPTGLHRQGVELYSHSRFCIFTGELVEERREILEADPADLADLEAQMMASRIQLIDLKEYPQQDEDDVIIQKCRQRTEKFGYLWEGNWKDMGYPSQSEADHALVGIICGATYSNSQAQRIFEKSGLYRPDKTHKFRYSLRRVRAKQQQEKDNEAWTANLLAQRKQQINPLPDFARNDPTLYTTIPNGLLKDFYDAYLANAYRPLKEGALAAAMVTALALFSRKYQTETGMALNLWVFLIGPPGSGKEIINKGPIKLFERADAQMTGVMGGEFRSAAGLEDALKVSPRHVSYVNEVNTWLAALCDNKSGTTWGQLRTKLMESYTKGADVMMLRQKKLEKGESKEYRMERPCLTVYGDCTAEVFYSAVGTEHVSSGFLPRFTVLQVDQESRTMERSKRAPFPEKLLEKVRLLAQSAVEADVPMIGRPEEIPMELDARKLFEQYEDSVLKKMLGHEGESLTLNLLTRLAEKVLKIATLCAVCANPYRASVTVEHVEWAMLFVKVTDGRMAAQLASGEHDPAAHQQQKVLQQKLDLGRMLSPKDRAKRFFPEGDCRNNPDLITYAWLRNEAGRLACFKNDRRGIPVALATTLRDLEQSGDVILIPPDVAKTKYNCGGMVIINCREVWADASLF